jgi:hypothetical protein
MVPEIIDIHWCVHPTTGEGQVRKYHRYLCSRCRLSDKRVFGLCIPEDQYETTKQRLEASEGKNG